MTDDIHTCHAECDRPICKAVREALAQREWQGLTDDEINTAAYNNHPLDGIRAFARAIEAKLKDKNGY